jgi:alanine-glyoxylate transaminase/serine-glyoxylate transaminase/serine-pyruvate transaminase
VLAYQGDDPSFPAPSWRRGVQADLVIEQRLRPTPQHAIKAVCVVHNETSTGVTSDIAAVRRAIDAAGHPALLMVDTISGLASADYRHDEWGVDVDRQRLAEGPDAAAGHQLQRAVAQGARGVAKTAKLPKAFWAWDEIIEMNK